jgi:hypothetical protein
MNTITPNILSAMKRDLVVQAIALFILLLGNISILQAQPNMNVNKFMQMSKDKKDVAASSTFNSTGIQSKGSTFFVDTGGDLDKELTRSYDKDAVGNFSIEVKSLPKKFATLAISAYDTDEERGELVLIYLNDQKLGKLAGTDNVWNTTVFTIPKGVLKIGTNNIRFVVKDSSKSGVINWTSKLGWGQILLDGGASDAGNLSNVSHELNIEKGIVTVTSTVIAKKTGKFKLETTIFDAQGNALETENEEFDAKNGTENQHQHMIPFDLSLPTHYYKIVSNLFYKAEIVPGSYMWMQQTTLENNFQYVGSDFSLSINEPIEDIIILEDADPIAIDLNNLFKISGLTDEQMQELEIALTVVNNNPEMSTTSTANNIVQFVALPDQHGTSILSIEGKLGTQIISYDVNIIIESVLDWDEYVKYNVYGAIGSSIVKGYDSQASVGIGLGITLKHLISGWEFLPGLKAGVEYIQYGNHSTTNEVDGVTYQTDLSINSLDSYVGLDFNIPSSWLSDDSVWSNIELSVKQGIGLISQTASSIADSSSQGIVTNNSPVSSTDIVISSAFGINYHLNSQWLFSGEWLSLGSDINTIKVSAIYNID